jgi:uncharacterized protein YwlG (UPF0340 family)
MMTLLILSSVYWSYSFSERLQMEWKALRGTSAVVFCEHINESVPVSQWERYREKRKRCPIISLIPYPKKRGGKRQDKAFFGCENDLQISIIYTFCIFCLETKKGW